jgi:hypothetical protein
MITGATQIVGWVSYPPFIAPDPSATPREHGGNLPAKKSSPAELDDAARATGILALSRENNEKQQKHYHRLRAICRNVTDVGVIVALWLGEQDNSQRTRRRAHGQPLGDRNINRSSLPHWRGISRRTRSRIYKWER